MRFPFQRSTPFPPFASVAHSPVELRRVLDVPVFVKRDDLLQLKCGAAGNKARKFYSLDHRGLPSSVKWVFTYGGVQVQRLFIATLSFPA